MVTSDDETAMETEEVSKEETAEEEVPDYSPTI